VFAIGKSATVRAIVEVEGEALSMPWATYQEHLANCEFRGVADDYRDDLLDRALQSTVCCAFHNSEQRLAGWLLRLSDQSGRDIMALTQEFMASLLGVQRPTISIAAHQLQAKGVINYSHGKVTIVDREGLTQEACECSLQPRRAADRRPAAV